MKRFKQHILDWFQEHARELPWRKKYDPYHVWISEIMLQQTQMDRMVGYFNRWVASFPDVSSLSRADEEEVLKLWEGLGYYARARNIMKTAAILQEQYNFRLPADYDLLLKLPGIGTYTAAAIMSIAFDREYPLVDANIERFFARFFDLAEPVRNKKIQAFIRHRVQELLPGGSPREVNQALMELGALVCIAGNPRCTVCPVQKDCRARAMDRVSERPVQKKPPRTVFIEMATGILQRNGRILIQKRRAQGVWANLWEFPGGRLEPGETPEIALVREYLEETELAVTNLRKITTVQHSYTIYRVALHGYFCDLQHDGGTPVLHAAQEYRWIEPAELADYAFPAGHRKLITYLRNETTYFQDGKAGF